MIAPLLLGLALSASGSPPPPAPGAPPEGILRISFEPAEPVKGRDRAVLIRVEAVEGAGEALSAPEPPVIFASTGTLGPVVSAGSPGRFEATWTPSDSPQPEVLGLVAIAPRCPLCAVPLAAGAARLPIASSIDLPGKTDPGVLTRVEIAGRAFGPVRADAEGRFSLPVVVPPGARWGFATSQSALGNEKRTRLDLHVSEEPGLHCAAWPGRLPADGRSEAGLHCVGWSASGAVADPVGVVAAAGRGAVFGATSAEGRWRAGYRAPKGGAGEDRLAFSWRGAAKASAELRVGLAPGAPATIEWRLEGEPVVPGGEVGIQARTLDGNGDPLGIPLADGRPIVGGRLRVRAELGDGVQRVKLSWSEPPGGAPAFLSLGEEGGAWLAVLRDVELRPVAGAGLRFGSGAHAVTDARGEARIPRKTETERVEGPAGLRAEGRAGSPPFSPPIYVERELRIALRPPGTIDVDAALDGGWIRWTVRGEDGAPLADRAVRVAGEGVALGPPERRDGGGRCAVRGGKGTVAVVDVESGATALVEVR